MLGARCWRPYLRSSRCCPKRRDRPTPSPGTSRIGSLRIARTSLPDGALCRQHGFAREQCLRTGMDVGGSCARSRPQRVRDPAQAFKSKRAHVVVLNDAAWSIVQAQRGLHPIWVFPYRGRRVSTMNNTAWQRARQEADLRAVRIHDLRHTFGCRLRAAGVSAEDRDAPLGHANRSMAGHYASADIGRLLKLANLVLNRQETRTVLRVANAAAPVLWIEGPARVRQQDKRARLRLVSP